jgi:hypothetical protein
VATDVVRRQLQPGVRFPPVTFDDRTRVAGDVQHWRVLGQCVNHQSFDPAIARVQHRVLKQPRSESTAAIPPEHGHTELGEAARLRFGFGLDVSVLVGEMGNCNEFQPSIENAKYLVVPEVDPLDITGDLFIRRRMAEPEIPVGVVECDQMRKEARAMALRQ